MGKLFALISQLRNLTNRRVGFEVSPDDYCPVPDLPSAKTRQVKLSRILRCLRERGSDWKIRVLVDDQFTGIEINPLILLKCTRITFRYGDGSDSSVLFVEGVPENFSDFWLRLKYFGFMRNIFWDGRRSFLIERSDSRVATKLRDIEAHSHGQHLASFLGTTTFLKSSSIHTQSSSPIRKAHSHEKIIRKKDSPVHPTIETQPNDVTAAAPEKPRILPVPRPPARPLPQSPPRTRSREEYSDFMVSEDSSDEDSLRDKADDSSSDTTDRVSPTRAGGGAGQRREENSPAPWEISGSGGLQRSIRREQIPVSHDHDPVQYMDSFVYVFLFCIALALVWLIPKLLF